MKHGGIANSYEYVADERFRNNIDKHANGTAVFVSKAIAGVLRQVILKCLRNEALLFLMVNHI